MKNIILLSGLIFLGITGRAFAADFPEKSLYQLKQEWTRQDGKKQTLESLQGKVWVAAMIYTHCSSACPLIVESIKKIERQLPPEKSGKVGFVLFSMDPKRDTPKSLKDFAKAHALGKENWLLLTSNKNTVQELSAALDFNFKEAANGMFIHQNTIFILDAEGVVIHQYPNLDEAVSEAAKALSGTSS